MSESDVVEAERADAFWRAIFRFLIKSVIVGVVVTVSLIYLVEALTDHFGGFVDRRIDHAGAVLAQLDFDKLSARKFWAGLERALDKAAAPDREMSPERQQKLLSDIHILAERARPFVAEAATVFATPPPTKAP
jgi:hypothetical protein